jgi:hypothetical protein
MIAIPEDAYLSGLHFSAGSRNGNVLLCNLSKANPTEVNGKPVNSAVLKPGDTFKAGMNIFAVIAAENPHEAKFRVGGWGFESIPEGWEINEGSGLRHSVTEPFRPNIIVVEESLPKGYDLSKYVALQISLGEKHLKAPRFSEPKPLPIKGAEQAMAITIHAQAEKGAAMQFQVYAVHSGIVGVMTATALESQGQLLRGAFREVLPGLTFFQG